MFKTQSKKLFDDFKVFAERQNQLVVILSEEIKASIAKSEMDIENGRLISNDKAMKHFREW